MHQWIASMERMAAKSHWHGTNRFDSFAPIRLNVAAQWLVDGVSSIPPAPLIFLNLRLSARLLLEPQPRHILSKGQNLHS